MKSHGFTLVSILLALVLIGPFLSVNSYTYLSADDFCRATMVFEDFRYNMAQWYLEHNGRYVNAFFSLLPVYNLTIYRIVLVLSDLFLGVALYFFFKSLFTYFNLKAPISKVLFITVLFYIVLISQLPSVYEFFYWYAGVSAYMYSIIFFLVLVSLLFKDLKSRGRILLAGFVVILVNGNNELLILLSNFILLILLFKRLWEAKRNFGNIVLLNFISWISSLAVVFAPGSVNRQSHYSEGGEVFYSLKSAILSSGMFALKSLLELPLILFYVGLICLFLYWAKSNERVANVSNPLIVGFLSLVGFTCIVFIPYYATGHLKLNEGRIGNMIHVIFLIIMCFNLINLSLFIQQRSSRIFFGQKIKYLPYGLIFTCLMVIALRNTNYVNLWKDFRKGEFERLEKDMNGRMTKLAISRESRPTIKTVKGTRILSIFNPSADKLNWENRCYTGSVNRLYGKNFEFMISE